MDRTCAYAVLCILAAGKGILSGYASVRRHGLRGVRLGDFAPDAVDVAIVIGGVLIATWGARLVDVVVGAVVLGASLVVLLSFGRSQGMLLAHVLLRGKNGDEGRHDGPRT
ncbi:MAG: hypothetical protein ACYCX5_13005 [Coriobacteriia bacterium]